jgi:hypothetical protein
MDSRLAALKETAIVAICELAVCVLTVIIYALIGRLNQSVWIGLLAGALLSVLNYYIMALTASRITDRAQANTDMGNAQGAMRLSYIVRLLVIFGVLAALAKFRLADPVAAVIPLLLMQPIIVFTQYICQRKVK